MHIRYPVERQAERQGISVPAESLHPWGHVHRVILSDISPQGCSATVADNQLLPGGSVILRTPSLFGAAGKVRWRRGLKAGIEFDQPLTREQVDQLLCHHASGIKLVSAQSEEDQNGVLSVRALFG